jgi:hypothetical protein
MKITFTTFIMLIILPFSTMANSNVLFLCGDSVVQEWDRAARIGPPDDYIINPLETELDFYQYAFVNRYGASSTDNACGDLFLGTDCVHMDTILEDGTRVRSPQREMNYYETIIKANLLDFLATTTIPNEKTITIQDSTTTSLSNSTTTTTLDDGGIFFVSDSTGVAPFGAGVYRRLINNPPVGYTIYPNQAAITPEDNHLNGKGGYGGTSFYEWNLSGCDWYYSGSGGRRDCDIPFAAKYVLIASLSVNDLKTIFTENYPNKISSASVLADNSLMRYATDLITHYTDKGSMVILVTPYVLDTEKHGAVGDGANEALCSDLLTCQAVFNSNEYYFIKQLKIWAEGKSKVHIIDMFQYSIDSFPSPYDYIVHIDSPDGIHLGGNGAEYWYDYIMTQLATIIEAENTTSTTTTTSIKPDPSCISVLPSTVNIGTTVDVTIAVQNIDLTKASSVNVTFGCTGVTVNSAIVKSATEIEANITVAVTERGGTCDVTITDANDVGIVCKDAFTVNQLISCFINVSPSPIRNGVFLPRIRVITLTGEGSNWTTDSTVKIEGINTIIPMSRKTDGTEIKVLAFIPSKLRLPAGNKVVTVTTGNEICTGSMMIE